MDNCDRALRVPRQAPHDIRSALKNFCIEAVCIWRECLPFYVCELLDVLLSMTLWDGLVHKKKGGLLVTGERFCVKSQTPRTFTSL